MAMGAEDHDNDTENTGSRSPQTADHTDALLWYRVEDENALTQDELEEKQKFEQSSTAFKAFVIALHSVDGSVHAHLNTIPLYAVLHFCVETVIVNIAIIVASTSVILQTVTAYNPERNSEWTDMWSSIDHLCFGFFTIEFLFRYIGSIFLGRSKQYWKDPLNWVDILSILPFYLEILFKSHLNHVVDTRFVRAARLVRITSAVKTVRFGNINLLVADIVSSSVAALTIPLFFMMLAAVVLGAFMYLIEGGESYCCEIEPNGKHVWSTCRTWIDGESGNLAPIYAYQPTGPIPASGAAESGYRRYAVDMAGECSTAGLHWFRLTYDGMPASGMYDTIPTGIWWAVVTFSTVGYGDKFPVTFLGRLINFFAMFLGIFFLAMPVAIIGDAFVSAWKRMNIKRNSKAIRRMLITGAWKPDLSRLGRVQMDILTHVSTIEVKVNSFCSSRSKEEIDEWKNMLHDLYSFKREFETVWQYYNIDVEQLRSEIKQKFDLAEAEAAKKIQAKTALSARGKFSDVNKKNTPTDSVKIVNPIMQDFGAATSSSDDDG